MKHTPQFSIRDRFHEAIAAFRRKLNIKPAFTMAELARRNGVPIEFVDSLEPEIYGWLDPDNKPARYICVNRHQQIDQQVFSIAFALATSAQRCRVDSLILNRRWKWQALDSAPNEIKEKIYRLDANYRAQILMTFCATGSEFRAFFKRNPTLFFTSLYADILIHYYLVRSLLQTWIFKFFYALAFL